MADGVQTTGDGLANKPQDRHDEDSQHDLTSGPIAPGADALEIEAAKQDRFNSGDDTVQGEGGVNFGPAPAAPKK